MRVYESITPVPGFQQLVVGAAAVALTLPAKSPAANVVQIVVETNDVRYRDDGTAPTAAVGVLLKVGSILTYDGPLGAIQFIQVTAGATLDCAYYRVQ